MEEGEEGGRESKRYKSMRTRLGVDNCCVLMLVAGVTSRPPSLLVR